MSSRFVTWILFASVVCVVLHSTAFLPAPAASITRRADAAPEGFFNYKMKLPEDAQPGATTSQILQLFRSPVGGMELAGTRERARGGDAGDVYAKVAPAVVGIRTETGFGSGFVVDPDGWIVTNHHVIAEAELDPKTGTRVAQAYFGHFNKDGFMEVTKPGIRVTVYRSDPVRDLALLKLDSKPTGVKELPFLSLGAAAKPASPCIAIGHPAIGAMWSVREGKVTGVGNWPDDTSRELMKALSGVKKVEPQKVAAAGPKVKAVFSDCSIFSGDSGGPLLDRDGKVVAVTVAVGNSGELASGAFSYHIHRDELETFLKDKPAQAPQYVPNPWPAATRAKFLDLDGDGKMDTLILGAGEEMTGVLLDLDQKSGEVAASDLADPKSREKWKFRVAIHRSPVAVFYDQTGTGVIDLILLGRREDGKAEAALRLKDGQWKREKGGQTLVDPSLIEGEKAQARMAKILKKLAE